MQVTLQTTIQKTLALDFVNPAGPDTIGNYYIKGEVVSNDNATIQNLKITAHWYDSTHKLIGVTFGYTDSILQPLDTGKRATFTILGDGHSDLIGDEVILFLK
jgi:hypothetical protein